MSPPTIFCAHTRRHGNRLCILFITEALKQLISDVSAPAYNGPTTASDPLGKEKLKCGSP